MTICKLIIIILFIPRTGPIFLSKYNKVLGKAKDYYKTHFKSKGVNFMGYDNTQYPGTNPTYIKLNKDKWEEYYSCLKLQNSSAGEDNTINPEALLGFEGSAVSFDCKICLSPEERENLESLEWFWAPLGTSHLSPVEYSEHIVVSPEDKVLTLYNLEESQTGQYMCILGSSLTAPYFLTVVNSTTNISEVHTPFAKQGPYPKDPYNISSYNLTLGTIWSGWSRCSVCGKAGKRHKLGYCVIYSLGRRNESASTEKDANGITQEDLAFVSLFDNGIPCASHILPESIKTLPEVKSRTNEIIIGYCKKPCPKDVLFEVKDKDGKVIETANNSAGIYSTLQGIPPVEPSVSRRLMYERMGEKIILSCPGSLNTDSPIQWQIGSKKLIPDVIAKQTKRRIVITLTDKINIMHGKVSDSNIYSCWQNNELAGTIRLIVEKKFKMTFNHHIMLFGIVLILSVFVYIFAKAFFGRKYART